MTTYRSQVAVAGLLLLAGAVLHGYENLVLSTYPDAWFYLWSLLPYVVCLIVLVLAKNPIPTIAAASVALAIDGLAHYEVFINPKGSTAALVLLFAPLWNTIIFVPATMLVTRLVVRRRNAHAP